MLRSGDASLMLPMSPARSHCSQIDSPGPTFVTLAFRLVAFREVLFFPPTFVTFAR